jgi:hypothetical protein
MKWLVITGIIGLLPIWRDPNWEGGVNAYQALYLSATLPQKEHVLAEQAIEECRQAYQESI